MTDLILTTFATLFVVVDPVALAPLFGALTQGMDAAEKHRIALRACLIGFGVLVLFGIAGEQVLRLIGISMPAFRISGGILLFIIAVEMLFEKRTERRDRSAERRSDPTVFPLAVPLIAGPGAIATMILLTGRTGGDVAQMAAVFGVLALVILATWLFFLAGAAIERVLGHTGTNVITRLLGLLLAALAVQFVLDGLKAYGVFGG
jgi:multiple antibiotic resistance protein